MNSYDFFLVYISALKDALTNEDNIENFRINSPDWYIIDDDLRQQVYLFEEKNYESCRCFFDTVALYFDAKAHGITNINGEPIEVYREILESYIEKYKQLYPC